MTDGPGFGGAQDFMEIASAAMKTCDLEQANLLYQRVGGPNGVLDSMDPKDPGAVIPYMADFVASYVSLESTPPSPGQDLTSWARGVGVSLYNSLGPFVSWVSNVDNHNNALDSANQSLLISLVLTGLVIPITGPWAIAAGIGANFIQGPVQDILQKTLLGTGRDPVTDTDLLRLSARAAAQVYITCQLIEEHRLYIDGKPPNQAEAQQLLATIARDAKQETGTLDQDISRWTIDGDPNDELYDKLSDAGDQILHPD